MTLSSYGLDFLKFWCPPCATLVFGNLTAELRRSLFISTYEKKKEMKERRLLDKSQRHILAERRSFFFRLRFALEEWTTLRSHF